MSEDLTKKLLQSTDEKLTLVLTLVQSLTARFDNVDVRFNNLDSRFDKVDSRLASIDSRLVHVEQGQQQLQEGQRQLQEGQDILFGELYKLSRLVSHRFLTLSGTTNVEIRDLKERVTRVELILNPPKPET